MRRVSFSISLDTLDGEIKGGETTETKSAICRPSPAVCRAGQRFRINSRIAAQDLSRTTSAACAQKNGTMQHERKWQGDLLEQETVLKPHCHSRRCCEFSHEHAGTAYRWRERPARPGAAH